MRVPAWKLRAAVLLLLGAVGVHDLRYRLPGARLDEHAHAYMGRITPLAFALVALGLAEFALRVARRGRPSQAPPRGLWAWMAVLLAVTYVGQETGEQLLTHGGAEGWLHAVVHQAGWLALPLAVCVGAAAALLLHGAAAVEQRAVRTRAHRRRSLPVTLPPALRRRGASRDVLARNLAGRAPPAHVG